jgi:hypothetical protein
VAGARARWIKEALGQAAAAQIPTSEQIGRLTALRTAYEELTEAYEALRRMVERGYVAYRPAGAP